VRGFTVVYHEAHVRSGRGLSDLTVGKWRMKELYHRYYLFILICTYHCERIHSGIP